MRVLMTENEKYRDRIIKAGLNVAYYRKYRGLTQEVLAERIEMTRDFISKIEAPDVFTSMSMKTLFKIADALDIPPHKLLDFRDE